VAGQRLQLYSRWRPLSKCIGALRTIARVNPVSDSSPIVKPFRFRAPRYFMIVARAVERRVLKQDAC
jgi:hypothetical protein